MKQSRIDIGATADFGPVDTDYTQGPDLVDDSKSRESDQSRDQLFKLHHIKHTSPKKKKPKVQKQN